MFTATTGEASLDAAAIDSWTPCRLIDHQGPAFSISRCINPPKSRPLIYASNLVKKKLTYTFCQAKLAFKSTIKICFYKQMDVLWSYSLLKGIITPVLTTKLKQMFLNWCSF